ncbi:hypothetical protein G7046_g4788 [Stylonectria norvegica]|nr:hypothetical protein G7046_g4788 [Stylonectria norvegica]
MPSNEPNPQPLWRTRLPFQDHADKAITWITRRSPGRPALYTLRMSEVQMLARGIYARNTNSGRPGSVIKDHLQQAIDGHKEWFELWYPDVERSLAWQKGCEGHIRFGAMLKNVLAELSGEPTHTDVNTPPIPDSDTHDLVMEYLFYDPRPETYALFAEINGIREKNREVWMRYRDGNIDLISAAVWTESIFDRIQHIEHTFNCRHQWPQFGYRLLRQVLFIDASLGLDATFHPDQAARMDRYDALRFQPDNELGDWSLHHANICLQLLEIARATALDFNAITTSAGFASLGVDVTFLQDQYNGLDRLRTVAEQIDTTGVRQPLMDRFTLLLARPRTDGLKSSHSMYLTAIVQIFIDIQGISGVSDRVRSHLRHLRPMVHSHFEGTWVTQSATRPALKLNPVLAGMALFSACMVDIKHALLEPSTWNIVPAALLWKFLKEDQGAHDAVWEDMETASKALAVSIFGSQSPIGERQTKARLLLACGISPSETKHPDGRDLSVDELRNLAIRRDERLNVGLTNSKRSMLRISPLLEDLFTIWNRKFPGEVTLIQRLHDDFSLSMPLPVHWLYKNGAFRHQTTTPNLILENLLSTIEEGTPQLYFNYREFSTATIAFTGCLLQKLGRQAAASDFESIEPLTAAFLSTSLTENTATWLNSAERVFEFFDLQDLSGIDVFCSANPRRITRDGFRLLQEKYPQTVGGHLTEAWRSFCRVLGVAASASEDAHRPT